MDVAWSQLLEAQANRDSRISIIVFDVSLIDSSILKICENVGYVNGIGFIAVINSQKGDYSNLGDCIYVSQRYCAECQRS